LSDIGPASIIISSVPEHANGDTSAVLAYSRNDEKFWEVNVSYIPAYYPGTGDIFASIILGSLLSGSTLPVSLEKSVNFINSTIGESFRHDLPHRDGILFERALSSLTNQRSSHVYEIVEL
jgi:pyridoxine kinase